MKAILSVEKINKFYEHNHVLKDVSFNVNKGEILAIIGSSGSGKSTILRCISQLEKINSGKIKINDEIIQGNKKLSSKVGMVFQNFNLFPHYTVVQNISKPLMIVNKVPEREANKKALELLRKVKLQGKENSYPHQLSGGQKQRVAIARAMALEPDIYLFDEPTSALDPELSIEVFNTIKGLAEEGQTMIIVTHQINFIKNIANKIIFMENGEILKSGNVEEMFNNYDENNKIKRFIDLTTAVI